MKTFQGVDESAQNYSSNIKSIDYEDGGDYPLIVEFYSGTYRFNTGSIYDEQERKFLWEMGLERKPYELLLEADSVGKAFNKLVKGNCEYKKVK